MKRDVICVGLDDMKIKWVYHLADETEEDVEAVVSMAVMRQGVEDRFFVPVPRGQFKKGDQYHG